MSKTPDQVGPYRIVRQLGRGGMAVVYLAKQPVLARSVALKELAPFLAGDPALAQRFIREARVAGSLSHPNVVTVFDFLEQDGVPYIAMEYLERGSLRPFVGRMSLAQIAGVLEGLLAALSHAEAMKIVHRDIKPENLLVTSEGGIKIADFGIAKAIQQVATEEMLTPAGATVGTPAYMAPEQAMAQEIGGWTDLYQTGVVAYELLTGEVPFRTEGTPVAVLMKHITDPVPPLPAGTDPALEAWVRRMMAKDPTDRPRNARAAWTEFEDIVLEAEGPRWRRDARLGEHEPTVEHPTPLTPAHFSSWQNYVPAAGSIPPPPPSPPPAATSGYVEYVGGATRDAAPAPTPPAKRGRIRRRPSPRPVRRRRPPTRPRPRDRRRPPTRRRPRRPLRRRPHPNRPARQPRQRRPPRRLQLRAARPGSRARRVRLGARALRAAHDRVLRRGAGHSGGRGRRAVRGRPARVGAARGDAAAARTGAAARARPRVARAGADHRPDDAPRGSAARAPALQVAPALRARRRRRGHRRVPGHQQRRWRRSHPDAHPHGHSDRDRHRHPGGSAARSRSATRPTASRSAPGRCGRPAAATARSPASIPPPARPRASTWVRTRTTS